MVEVPESIAASARARIRETAEERSRVLQAVRAGQPLEAEEERSRKIERFQAVTGVNQQQAENLADYADPASLGLADEARLGAERIQGRTTDFVGVSFLELARNAANAVARVVFRNGQPLGSGFMISDQLFLTNNHVIASREDCRELLIEFNRELGTDRRPKPVTQFALDPARFFATNPEDDLDFTVVAVGERVRGSADLDSFGCCPLLATDDKHILGEFVNVIQHPDGDYKQVVLRENLLVARLDTVLHYLADTQPGSSGSPVFNDQWEVIALHHWGEPFREIELPNGQPVQREVNEGIRISAIVRSLKERLSMIDATEQQLLALALDAHRRRPASTKPEQSGAAPGPEPERPATSPHQPQIAADGSVTWTIPLEISVRLAGAVAPTGAAHPATNGHVAPVPEQDSAAPEAIRIDRNYANRGGYDPNFLPGHRVCLPALSAKQQQEAARKLSSAADEDPYELTYEHFSIVMHAGRRMAFFTAANLDGATWININRETGEPREAAEAREVWFDDPRIAADAQCDQSLYDRQQPRRVFDRGHLVRRQDPTWGTNASAKRANADTFHFTNCTPQESQFNQSSQYWQGIEEYVLDNAKAERLRVSVFTGPVFADDDPLYRDVHVPRKFWKIVARVEDGVLLATALLADQSERIQQLPERLSEGFDDTSEVRQFQTTVREIERLTGLDFGPLRDHDTFQPGEQEAMQPIRHVRSFRTIYLDRPDNRT
ncbi:MAG: DNA/RNA non-specific endonuclease [Chloroflexi bacterium]|nr:DNA/RNA non-specific endonuclease [Chloroflexota bacterium]